MSRPSPARYQEVAASVRTYLANHRGIAMADMANDRPLFTSGLLDSLDIVQLVAFLETNFDVQITALDVSIEYFDTIDAIVGFVIRRTGAGGAPD